MCAQICAQFAIWSQQRRKSRSVPADGEKPDIFYTLVEKTCPAPLGGYLELFARKQRTGWVTWATRCRGPRRRNDGRGRGIFFAGAIPLGPAR